MDASIILHTGAVAAGALASICDRHGNQLGTAYLKPVDLTSASTKLVGKFEWVPSAADPTAPPKIQAISLPEQGGSLATLSSIRDRQGGAKLELCIWRKGRPDPLTIGQIDSCDELCDWATKKLAEVGQSLQEKKPITAKLRGIGVELGDRVLNPKGRERLLQVSKEVETCLITSDMRIVPWEWLIPDRAPQGTAIADVWDTVRWHPSDHKERFNRMAGEVQPNSQRCFATIGVKSDPQKKWHLGIPLHLEELGSWLHQPGWKHLIAHCEDGKYRLGLAFWVTCTDILGSPPDEKSRPEEIVLSCCSAGALDDPNLAVIFAERWGCRAWAPLTTVEPPDVLELDAHLASELMKSSTSLSRSMRTGRTQFPLLKLYVQYGVQPS